MSRKNNLFLMRSLLVVILFFSMICFVLAEENFDNIDVVYVNEGCDDNSCSIPDSDQKTEDYSSKFKDLIDGDIQGQGMKYEKIGDGEGARFTFSEENPRMRVKGRMFENIKSQDEAGLPSSIELDENGEIENAEFTVNEKGGTYVFGNTELKDVPANTRVIYNKKMGMRFILEDGAEVKELPKLKDNSKPGEAIIYESKKGESFWMKDRDISGKLEYKGGKLFIAPGQKTIINDVKIENYNPAFGAKNMDVYFDGKEHKGTYVSFGDKTFVASSAGGEGVIGFEESNPYLKIDKGDYVAMQTEIDSSIKIENRDSEGLIPKVTTKGEFKIDEDSKSIYTFGNKVKMQKYSFLNKDSKIKSTTSPIELVTLDEKGVPLMKNHKVLVDNFNRYAIVPAGEEEAFVKFEGLDAKFSSRVKYNYPKEKDIRKLTKANLNFENLPKGNKDMVMGKFRDYWDGLGPGMQTSVERHSITFANSEAFSKIYGEPGSEGAGAFAKIGYGMVFREDENFNFKTFVHESAHMHNFALEDLDKRMDTVKLDVAINLAKKQVNTISIKQDEITDRLSELKRMGYDQNSLEIINLKKEEEKFRKLYNGAVDKWTSVFKNYNSNNFENKWKKTAGDVYVGEEWDDLFFTPKGIVRRNSHVNYGAKNYREDIATHMEIIKTKPSDFAKLVKKEPIHLDKLNMLYNDDFISTSEYNFILKEAGLK